MNQQDYTKILRNHGPSAAAFLWYLIECDEYHQNHDKTFSNGTVNTSRNKIAQATTLKKGAQYTCENKLINAGILTVNHFDGGIIYTINYSAI